VTAVERRKVALIAGFLEESFVGCSVYDQENEGHLGQVYQIVNDTTEQVLHCVIVSRAFLNEHDEIEIVPTLQKLCLLVCLSMAAGRRVTVKSQMIEIEQNARRLSGDGGRADRALPAVRDFDGQRRLERRHAAAEPAARYQFAGMTISGARALARRLRSLIVAIHPPKSNRAA